MVNNEHLTVANHAPLWMLIDGARYKKLLSLRDVPLIVPNIYDSLTMFNA